MSVTMKKEESNMTENVPVKKRRSNIELLRILMMLQIIFLHISDYGDYTEIANELGGRTELIYWLVWLMNRCPVYVFVVIMGYFLSTTGDEFNVKRILKVYQPMWFYSVAIPVICCIVSPKRVSGEYCIKAFIPFLSRTWYFMTLYILVLIISPYLNRMIDGLDRKRFLMLIGICFFLFSIWQPLSMLEPFEGIIGTKKILFTQGGKSLYDFIYMYILGAFLRKYHIFSNHENIPDKSIWNNPLVYLSGFILMGLINLLIVNVYPDQGIESIIGYNDNPVVVLQCVLLFRTFEKLDLSRFPKLGNVINYISAGNMGVYMIHEHPLIRPLIWDEIFATYDIEFYSHHLYLLKFLMIMLIVYFTCWSIDWMRKMCAKFISKFLTKISQTSI